jgi:hypothetical protein
MPVCGDCHVIYAENEKHKCKLGCFTVMKDVEGKKCPECGSAYVEVYEPVEVIEPWKNTKCWESCWKCFTTVLSANRRKR